MDTTTARRGATAKFLALIASLTMLVAGLVGVSLASPASATGQNIAAKALTDHSCDTSEWHFIINQVSDVSLAPASISVTWANDATAVLSRYDFTGGVAHYKTTANLDSTVTSATTSIYPGWTGAFNLSHGPCSAPSTTSLTVNKAWVGTNGPASQDLASKLDATDAGALTVKVDGVATGQAWGATQTGLTVGGKVVVTEGPVPALKPADFPNGYTCTVVTREDRANSAKDFTLDKEANSFTVTNAVQCTAVPAGTTSLTVNKAWVATGTGEPGTASATVAATLNAANNPANAGTLTVTVGTPVANPAWGVPISGLTPGGLAVVSEGAVPALNVEVPTGFTCTVVAGGYPTYSPSSSITLTGNANTVTVTNAVSCAAIPATTGGGGTSTPPTTTTTTTSPAAPGPAAVVAVQPAVIAPAPAVAVTAPVAAPAPVKKPVKVPTPGSVSAGVAGVAAPTAATVPSAVPAGDGSQAPGLPMWALVLIVVGALGAVVAAKQMLGARN